MVVRCGRGGVIHNLPITSQCLSRSFLLGLWSYQSHSSDISYFLPFPLYPSLVAVFPMYFLEDMTSVDNFGCDWKARGIWYGKNALSLAGP